MCEVHWTAYFQALLAPVVGAFALLVGYQQWETARNKLRFDLFEKRFAVYVGAKNFIGSIVTSGNVSDENVYDYLRATSTTNWVVGREVDDYLKRMIYEPALELQALEAELASCVAGPVRSKQVARKSEIKANINSQFEELDRQFAAYLRLKH